MKKILFLDAQRRLDLLTLPAARQVQSSACQRVRLLAESIISNC